MLCSSVGTRRSATLWGAKRGVLLYGQDVVRCHDGNQAWGGAVGERRGAELWGQGMRCRERRDAALWEKDVVLRCGGQGVVLRSGCKALCYAAGERRGASRWEARRGATLSGKEVMLCCGRKTWCCAVEARCG